MPQRSLAIEATVSFLLAIIVLVAGAIDVVAGGPALVVGATMGALGVAALVSDLRAEHRRRAQADEVIETLAGDRIPEPLRWRVLELTAARERRRLAGSLRSLLRSSEDAVARALTPVPINWRALRRQRRTVEEIATLLADTRRPVSPRGVVLVRRLLLDAMESPLYSRHRASELAGQLARARAALSRDREA